MLPLFLFGLAGVLMLPGLLTGPSLDAAVFVHVAGRMLDGATLYVDAWDHKPPGIFLMEMASRLASGWLGSWPSAWLVSVISIAATGWLVAITAGRIGVGRLGRWLAGTAVVLACAQPLVSLGGGMTEPPATALAMAALALATGPIRKWTPAATGALLSGSILTSFLLLPAVVVVGALTIAHDRRMGSVAGLVLGAGLPLAAVGAWLAGSGAVAAAWDALIVYNAAYRDANRAVGFELSRPVISWLLLCTLFVVPPAALGAMTGLRARGESRGVAAACLGWIGVVAVLVVFQNRVFAHYAVAVLAPAGVLCALGVEGVRERWRRATGPRAARRRWLLGAPLAIALLVSVAAAAALGTANEVSGLTPGRIARIEAVASAVDQLVDQQARVLVWGNEPRLYLELGRPIAIRYPYFFPLTTPGYASEALTANLLAELRASPPAAIIDAGSWSPGAAGFLPLLIGRPVATTGRDADFLDSIRAFVATRYALADIGAGWPIYVRNDLIIRLEAPGS